jgi:hypothetical protein
MTGQEIGERLAQDRRSLWSSVQFGPYTLMQQGACVLLVKDNTIVWSEIPALPRDHDQRQPNFD